MIKVRVEDYTLVTNNRAGISLPSTLKSNLHAVDLSLSFRTSRRRFSGNFFRAALSHVGERDLVNAVSWR